MQTITDFRWHIADLSRPESCTGAQNQSDIKATLTPIFFFALLIENVFFTIGLVSFKLIFANKLVRLSFQNNLFFFFFFWATLCNLCPTHHDLTGHTLVLTPSVSPGVSWQPSPNVLGGQGVQCAKLRSWSIALCPAQRAVEELPCPVREGNYSP